MNLSDKTLEDLQNTRLEVVGKYRRLLTSYMMRNYRDPRAREYATHGFLRRVKILVRCINNVFEILPPDLGNLPTDYDLSDAMIYIQAFVFNVFGSIDNLARVWVHENGLTRDGSPIPDGWIGLREKNKFVRSSFSPEFQDYLKRLNGWFDNLENFRHALAHRIPLYIPPYTVPTDQEAAYRRLVLCKMEPVMQRDADQYKQAAAEQQAIAAFVPCMLHSLEKPTPIYFHPQMLCDFRTIEDLAQQMLRELDS